MVTDCDQRSNCQSSKAHGEEIEEGGGGEEGDDGGGRKRIIHWLDLVCTGCL